MATKQTTATEQTTGDIHTKINEHQLTALANTAKLLINPKYSDLTITCDGREFKVHKAIVCSASPVLAAECDHRMREASTGVIEHAEFDPDTVERMLVYIYTQAYALPEGFELDVPALGANSKDAGIRTLKGANAKMYAHARVYAIADFYDLSTLVGFASAMFLSSSTTSWDADGFIEVVGEVYKRTTKYQVLRMLTRRVAMCHIVELTQNDVFMAELGQLEHVQEFAAEMLRQSVKTWNTEAAILDEQIAETKEVHTIEKKDIARHIKNMQSAYKADLASKTAELSGIRAMFNKVTEEGKRTEETMQALVESVQKLAVTCMCDDCDGLIHHIDVELVKSTHPVMGEDVWVIRCSNCGGQKYPTKKRKLSDELR